MLASLAWLRALSSIPDDVDRVAWALTSRGLTVDSVEPVEGDHALDIDVPANRPDCLGHLGLAREVAAAFAVPLQSEPDSALDDAGLLAERISIEVDEPRLCPRYTARVVLGVKLGPSPPWVVRRLETCGLRSINNVVDASNLVLLELGHPVHFFDLDRLEGATVRIRRARAAERLTTLDGQDRELHSEFLVIADAHRAVALAGIIGGADSEIGESTEHVLIEAAVFDRRSVRATARLLGLQTDASHRFERGVDPQGVVRAQTLAVRLLGELAGGQALPGMIDDYPAPYVAPRLTLRPPQLERLLGYQPSDTETCEALTALSLAPRRLDDGRLEVSVPSWRVDLEREADLVEEVARHLGYDRIPLHAHDMPSVTDAHAVDPLEERARDVLAHLGFQEAYGYAMIAHEEDGPFVDPEEPSALALTNPIAESSSHLRRSLLPGLLRAMDLNLRRGLRDVRLFEVGRVFRPRGDDNPFPREPSRVGVAWSGAGQPRHWGLIGRTVDLFDVMGVTEQLLGTLRPGLSLRPATVELPGLHPGRAVCWTTEGGDELARAGQLHPDLQREVSHEVFVAEIELGTLASIPLHAPRYSSVARLTPVTRDLALVMPGGVSYESVRRAMLEVSAPAPAAIEPVDRYVGPPLAPGESSLTVRVTLTPNERTLTEAEIEGYRRALIAVVEDRLGLRIRS
jgi:phenylalanyl-tRNA synthetase beta chain